MSRKRYPKPARFRIALIAGQAAIGCLYTVQASGAGGGTGTALVEVYEVP